MVVSGKCGYWLHLPELGIRVAAGAWEGAEIHVVRWRRYVPNRFGSGGCVGVDKHLESHIRIDIGESREIDQRIVEILQSATHTVHAQTAVIASTTERVVQHSSILIGHLASRSPTSP